MDFTFPSFGASEWLCVMIEAFPGYLHILFLKNMNRGTDFYKTTCAPTEDSDWTGQSDWSLRKALCG